MRKIRISLFSLIFIIVSAPIVNSKDYGKIWLNLPRSPQTWYVGGYTTGYVFGHAIAKFNMGISIEILGQDKELPRIFSLDAEVIADTMSQLYKEPANRLIPFGIICEHAIKKVMGMDRQLIEKSLQESRKTDWDQIFRYKK